MLEDEQPYEVEEEAVGMSDRLAFVEDIDADDADDPTMVVEYVQDIFKYMKELEVSLVEHTPDDHMLIPGLCHSDYHNAQRRVHGGTTSPQVGNESPLD